MSMAKWISWTGAAILLGCFVGIVHYELLAAAARQRVVGPGIAVVLASINQHEHPWVLGSQVGLLLTVAGLCLLWSNRRRAAGR